MRATFSFVMAANVGGGPNTSDRHGTIGIRRHRERVNPVGRNRAPTRGSPKTAASASPSGELVEGNSSGRSAIAIGSLSAALQVGGGGHMQVTELFDDFVVEVRVLEDALGFGQGKSQTLCCVLG